MQRNNSVLNWTRSKENIKKKKRELEETNKKEDWERLEQDKKNNRRRRDNIDCIPHKNKKAWLFIIRTNKFNIQNKQVEPKFPFFT